MGGRELKFPLFREAAATRPQSAVMIYQGLKWSDAQARAASSGRPSTGDGAATVTASSALKALLDTSSTGMTDALAARLDRCDPAARLPGQLVTALWDAMQASTQQLAPAWELIPGDTCSYTASTTAAFAQSAGRTVSARFFDIGLIARTAIADTTRAADGGGTYFLHANHLAPCCGLDFIAAQKPHRSEIGGFLQMLLAKKVGLVVDLTTTSEWEDDACYAPTQGQSVSVKSANVTVACEGHKRLPALRSTIKSLLIRCRDESGRADGAGHALQRLQFSGWTDHGVIAARTLRSLANQVETLHARSGGPILVHCMAGVGRTGTLISFIAARRRLRAQFASAVCPPGIVAAILMETIGQGRRDRGAGFVQTREQFALVLTTLLEEFGSGAAKVQAAPVAIAGPAMTAAHCLGLMSDVITDVVRQTFRHLKAQFAETGHAREDSAGHMPAPASASASAAAPTTIPAPGNTVNSMATTHVAQNTTGSAAVGKHAIAEDGVLASCHEPAIERRGEGHSAGAAGVRQAETVAAARHQGGPGFMPADTQQDILGGAVRKRFDCRDAGIIFQAHLVRNANGETLPVLRKKSGAKSTSGEPATGRGA